MSADDANRGAGVKSPVLSEGSELAASVAGSAVATSSRQPRDPASFSPLLSKQQFLRQMRLEKRRAERSKTSLSLVLFIADAEHPDGLASAPGLMDLLRSAKRETDFLGYLAGDRVALLLPDTNEAGAHGFTRNVSSRASNLQYSTIVSTYPDEIFASLVHGDHLLPESSPLYIDHSLDVNAVSEFLKRALDIIGSLALLLVLSPVMIATAIAIKATSPGPVIFKQSRLGKRGVAFDICKFRSMVTSSDDRIHREYVTKLIEGKHEDVNQGDAAKPIYKMTADPRITRVGHFIRKTSIDELPQLFNVLKGEMSLVGPRPPLKYEAEKYQIWHLRRILEVRPGITGLWQVVGRSTTAFDEMVRLDLRYIRERSFWLDVKILLLTVKVVLGGRGAT
jgi:exopolysaccharide biosynthesis polyprenyl glycosylphosphotransferase